MLSTSMVNNIKTKAINPNSKDPILILSITPKMCILFDIIITDISPETNIVMDVIIE